MLTNPGNWEVVASPASVSTLVANRSQKAISGEPDRVAFLHGRHLPEGIHLDHGEEDHVDLGEGVTNQWSPLEVEGFKYLDSDADYLALNAGLGAPRMTGTSLPSLSSTPGVPGATPPRGSGPRFVGRGMPCKPGWTVARTGCTPVVRKRSPGQGQGQGRGGGDQPVGQGGSGAGSLSVPDRETVRKAVQRATGQSGIARTEDIRSHLAKGGVTDRKAQDNLLRQAYRAGHIRGNEEGGKLKDIHLPSQGDIHSRTRDAVAEAHTQSGGEWAHPNAVRSALAKRGITDRGQQDQALKAAFRAGHLQGNVTGTKEAGNRVLKGVRVGPPQAIPVKPGEQVQYPQAVPVQPPATKGENPPAQPKGPQALREAIHGAVGGFVKGQGVQPPQPKGGHGLSAWQPAKAQTLPKQEERGAFGTHKPTAPTEEPLHIRQARAKGLIVPPQKPSPSHSEEGRAPVKGGVGPKKSMTFTGKIGEEGPKATQEKAASAPPKPKTPADKEYEATHKDVAGEFKGWQPVSSTHLPTTKKGGSAPEVKSTKPASSQGSKEDQGSGSWKELGPKLGMTKAGRTARSLREQLGEELGIGEHHGQEPATKEEAKHGPVAAPAKQPSEPTGGRPGGHQNGTEPAADRGGVAGQAAGSSVPATGASGTSASGPASGKSREGVSRGKGKGKGAVTPKEEGIQRKKIAKARLNYVHKRLDRYERLFRSKGNHEAADWIKTLKDHIKKHGVDHALEILGEGRQGGHTGKVQYEGAYDEPGETAKESDFIRRYLARAGVTLIHGNTPVDPTKPYVSGWSEANLKQEGRNRTRTGREGEYIPTDATFKNKLEETQHLPGLESTQDLHDVIGSHVKNFTPEVIRKLDAKYGKGKWIVKSYGDEAYAGFGVMFPQRIKQIQDDAKSVIHYASGQLREKGFKVIRDKNGMAVGVASIRAGKNKGKVVHFGSEEFNSLPKGVQKLGKQVRQAAPNEKGTMLPSSPEDSLHNNYGMTLRRDKNGKVVGVTDWEGREHDLGSKSLEKLEKQDGGAMGHELHRALEADEWRQQGFNTEPKFMVGPAFRAVGVSAADRAYGNTWETANEGRVHVIVKDGKASAVPYATLAGRGDSMPTVFGTKDVRDMERAAEEAINQLPESERKGQLYAPDVVKTKDGWRVLELNPAAAGGGSDWLGRNPFVIDAVTSHVVGRDPMHARFLRGLLQKAASKYPTPDQTPKNGTPPPTHEEAASLANLNPGLDQPITSGKSPKSTKSKKSTRNRWTPLNGWVPVDVFNMAVDEPRDARGRWTTMGSPKTVHKVRYGSSLVKFRKQTPRRVKGPSLGLMNYKQCDDHSCSFTAALTIAHHFDKSIEPRDVLKAVRPSKSGGLSKDALVDGLKKLGIDAEYRDDLTLKDLRNHVLAKTPVLITVYPKDWTSDHWTVVDGFSPGRIHLSNHTSLTTQQFLKDWYDKGEGLICRKVPPKEP